MLVVKNLPANAGGCNRHGFDPWVGKIPWRRAWYPFPAVPARGCRPFPTVPARGCRPFPAVPARGCRPFPAVPARGCRPLSVCPQVPGALRGSAALLVPLSLLCLGVFGILDDPTLISSFLPFLSSFQEQALTD